MDKLKDLIKESFELSVKMRWLKEINRATERYKKTYAKACREHYIMQTLIKKYNDLYNDNLGTNN